MKLNHDEVSEVQYVTMDKMKELMIEYKQNGVLISPWFDLICEKFLYKWWGQLDQICAKKGLSDTQEANAIHKLGNFKL